MTDRPNPARDDDGKPRGGAETPLADTLTGNAEAGGLAGQGGMTDVDNEDEDEA